MDNAPDFLKIRQMLTGPMVASNQPSFDQMPSPIERAPTEDAPQAVSTPIFKATGPKDDSYEDLKSLAELDEDSPEASADDSPRPDSLAKYRVTKGDLDSAADDKRRLALMGAITNTLGNQQSFGNFFTGHMAPKSDTSGYFKTLEGLADQPVQQKQALMKQELAKPGQDLAQQAADPNSPISKMVGSATASVMQKAGMPVDGIQGMSAMQVNEFLDKNPVIKEAVSQDNAMKKLQGVLAQASITNGLRERGLGIREDQAAARAGKDFEDNSIIKTAKNSLNSLDRSVGILNNTSKPVTTNDLNLAYTDYINAVANGGAATEGKIKRELPETFEGDWNTLKQKVGVNDDLRKTATGQALISMLKKNISQVQGDLNGAISAQAQNTASSYGSTSNQKVKDTVANKVKTYAQPSSLAETGVAPDVLAYAKEHGIPISAAQSIKDQRTKGGQ
jgi:hypothetical protein